LLQRLSGLEGNYLRFRNKVRRNGIEERPEWDACPAKPSKPLRNEAGSVVLPSGVRTEFLAGCISGFAVDLSAQMCALAHFCLRALREPRMFCAYLVTVVWSHIVDRFAVVHKVDRCAVIDKEDDCADVFTTSSNGT
jgi:hypothetical protein